MRTRITTTRGALALTLALAAAGLTPAAPVMAADREHQQLMADLRMLQEQTQQLQALMDTLGEALKAVNSRLDDQNGMERKAAADRKVQMDSISGDLRIMREKVDETNVRLGSISQELDSLRQAIPEPGAMPAPTPTTDGTPPGSAGAVPPGAATAAPAQLNPGSPQRAFDSSWADYTSANYSLAVVGFQSYLNSFPKSSRAHEAQLYVGESLLADKKDAEAVAAYDRVITNYPASASVPQAYFKRGMALTNLGDADKARESFETVIKQFPESYAAQLAKQRLETQKPAR
jgi:tol-pal system protein YbgF